MDLFFKWLGLAPVWIQGFVVVCSVVALLLIIVIVGFFIVKLAMRFYNFGFKGKFGPAEVDTSKDAPEATATTPAVKDESKPV